MSLKLLKHDLYRLFRQLIPVYTGALAGCFLTWLLLLSDQSWIRAAGKTMLFVSIVLLLAVLILTVLFLWIDFYRTMYLDPSYLTHTLPLKNSTIYTTKCMEAVLFSLITTAVFFLGGWFISNELSFLLDLLFEVLSAWYLAGQVFLQILLYVYAGFAGIIAGHMSFKSQLRRSVLWGFLFYLLGCIITLAVAGAGLSLNGFDIFTLNSMDPAILDALPGWALAAYLIADCFLSGIGFIFIRKGINVE